MRASVSNAAAERVAAHVESEPGRARNQSRAAPSPPGRAPAASQPGTGLAASGSPSRFCRSLTVWMRPGSQLVDRRIWSRFPRARHAGFVQRQHVSWGAPRALLGAQACHLRDRRTTSFGFGAEARPVVLLALAAPGVLALLPARRAPPPDRLAAGLASCQWRLISARFARWAASSGSSSAAAIQSPSSGAVRLPWISAPRLRHRLGAGLVAPLRHHGGLIPAADGGQVGRRCSCC